MINLEGDSCVAISIDQLKKINKRLIQRRYLVKEQDILNKQIEEVLSLSLRKDSIIAQKNYLISKYETFEKSNLEKIEECEREMLFFEKKFNAEKRKRKFLGNVCLGLGTIIIISLLVN